MYGRSGTGRSVGAGLQASVRQAREADQPEEDVRVHAYTSLFAGQLADGAEKRVRASSAAPRRPTPPTPPRGEAPAPAAAADVPATELSADGLLSSTGGATVEAADADANPQCGEREALTGVVSSPREYATERRRSGELQGLAGVSLRGVSADGDGAAGDDAVPAPALPSFNGGWVPSEGGSALQHARSRGTMSSREGGACFEEGGRRGSDIVDLSPRSRTPGSALASSSGRNSTPRERWTQRGVSFMPPLELRGSLSDTQPCGAPHEAAEGSVSGNTSSSGGSSQPAFSEPLTPGRAVPLAQRLVAAASPRSDDEAEAAAGQRAGGECGGGGMAAQGRRSSTPGSTPRSQQAIIAFQDTIRKSSGSWCARHRRVCRKCGWSAVCGGKHFGCHETWNSCVVQGARGRKGVDARAGGTGQLCGAEWPPAARQARL